MSETMLSATQDSTSLHFSLNHMCRKHKVLFTMEHVESCNEISGCSNIRRYARRLRKRKYGTGRLKRGGRSSLSSPRLLC